jgi:hypothetical protein
MLSSPQDALKRKGRADANPAGKRLKTGGKTPDPLLEPPVKPVQPSQRTSASGLQEGIVVDQQVVGLRTRSTPKATRTTRGSEIVEVTSATGGEKKVENTNPEPVKCKPDQPPVKKRYTVIDSFPLFHFPTIFMVNMVSRLVVRPVFTHFSPPTVVRVGETMLGTVDVLQDLRGVQSVAGLAAMGLHCSVMYVTVGWALFRFREWLQNIGRVVLERFPILSTWRLFIWHILMLYQCAYVYWELQVDERWGILDIQSHKAAPTNNAVVQWLRAAYPEQSMPLLLQEIHPVFTRESYQVLGLFILTPCICMWYKLHTEIFYYAGMFAALYFTTYQGLPARVYLKLRGDQVEIVGFKDKTVLFMKSHSFHEWLYTSPDHIPTIVGGVFIGVFMWGLVWLCWYACMYILAFLRVVGKVLVLRVLS